jgi:hypothetical protein
MRSTVRALVTGLAALTCSGCVTVSLHQNHLTDIVITDALNGSAESNIRVHVHYAYDSYGVHYILRTPADEEAITDSSGRATMVLAATDQHRIWMDLGPKSAIVINADAVRNGAELKSFPRGKDGRVYAVSFHPHATQ